ncbi:MAG: enoyl-CoA hydratase/isomerase family protein [Proteobacteria bacterium]|nr:enoyl-CoA hydratase/isomerase family protein [Pseudomonadota bacterium]MDA0981965.1 enoyl-CoA hydratase/isomerase family protein [Pseudomonadota bacterium]
MYRHLDLSAAGRIATVTLNRPEARNAMSAELMREMIACATQIAPRGDLDVVIVRGAGVCFSAGADLKDGSRWANQDMPLHERREIASLGYRMARAWEELPQITLAAIEGYAIGGGLALAAALDWRVVAKDAFVSLPEIALGIPLTWGTLPRLVNLVGPARAKRLTILCERIPADEALRIGLVDYVCASGKALEKARAVAKQVLDLPQTSVRMSKETIHAYASIGAHAATHMSHDQIQVAAGSAEAKSAREAFAIRKRAKGAAPKRR